MKKNVLSLFDGMSCCQIALNKLGVKDYTYYASEIEMDPIKVTMHNFPKTIQLGDVRGIRTNIIPQVWLLTGGSPCQSFSFAGKMKGMVTGDNIEVTSLSQYLKLKKSGFEFQGQSYLFWEYVRILKETKPKYFLLENVRMDKRWEDVITKTLGVKPILINSSLVSAQNRERLYWTNIPGVELPKDKRIMLSDIIKGGTGYGIRGRMVNGKNQMFGTKRNDGKSNCLVTQLSNTGRVMMKNKTNRELTIEECEKLQTIPVNYTNVHGISKTQRVKMIGNGWTVDVISHILGRITKPKKKLSKP